MVCTCSEAGVSPAAHSDNNGSTSINEIVHETAKYELKFLYIAALLISGLTVVQALC